MAEKKEESKIKKIYLSFQKKYSLPTIEQIESNFGTINIEDEKFILIDIRKKIVEKIEYLLHILGNIFEGDSNLVNLYESKTLDEKKKAKLFLIYRNLMKYTRESNILTLSYEEKAEAEFIKNFSKDFETIKKDIKKQLEEFRDSWEHETELTDDILNYLG